MPKTVTKKAEKPKKAVKAKTETPKKELKEKSATRTTKKVVKADEAQVVPQPSEEKQEIISQFQVKEGDTGSPEVQIALLTKRIEKLVSHLKSNPSDNHSRRGLLGIVSKRRRLINYLEKKDPKRYKGIIDKLDLGK
jgi:small subunit ribosomal protein S15